MHRSQKKNVSAQSIVTYVHQKNNTLGSKLKINSTTYRSEVGRRIEGSYGDPFAVETFGMEWQIKSSSIFINAFFHLPYL